ncbi:MAG: Bax inhibitor-1/YccA family protein [Chloroflexota bacterium]
MTGMPYSPAQLGVRPSPALVQRLLVGAFAWMFAGLLLSAAVAWFVATSPSLLTSIGGMWLVIVIAQLVLGIGIQMAINKISATVALLLFFVYAASMGLTIGMIVWATVQAPGGIGAVASAFFSASAMFGAAAVYGKVTKRDLSGLGAIAFMAVFGIVIASVVNIWLASSAIGWIISIVGVVVFTALTAYDVQKITNGSYAAITTSAERATVLAALRLYLDFINIFLFLLRIFGGSRN